MSSIARSADATSITLSFAALAIAYYLGKAVYDAFFGPLAKFPGPVLRKFSQWPTALEMMHGTDNQERPALHAKYGPIVRIGPDELSFAGGQQAWQDLYGFKKHGQAKASKHPTFYSKPLNGVPSVIAADDAGHSRQRKILTHAFSDKALKDQEPLLKRWADKMKSKLVVRAETGEKTDMLKYYNCTTFDIMGDLTFSEGLNMLEDSEYSPWVKTIFGGIKNATFLRAFRSFGKLQTYLIDEWLFKSPYVQAKQLEHWNYSTERVDRRLKRTPEHPDLWSKILEKSEGPDGLTIGEHHSTASLFMIAGTETTATALSGTTYHLLRNPDAMAKLSKEIRESFSSFEDLTLESLARQKYLMAVLQEGLRMYPPVPIALPRRVPEGGMAICGEFIPGGTSIGVHHLSTYRMESHFKHAYEFHPERWLGDPEFKDDHLDALEAFSTGPRNCLGKNLAWHEMRLLLAVIVLQFDLKLLDESKDWSDQKVFTLWEKKPLMCTLQNVKA